MAEPTILISPDGEEHVISAPSEVARLLAEGWQRPPEYGGLPAGEPLADGASVDEAGEVSPHAPTPPARKQPRKAK